jgi:hypothetical protein
VKIKDRFFLKVYFENSEASEEEKKIEVQKYIKRVTLNLNKNKTIVEECELETIKKDFAMIKLVIKT